MSGARAQVRRHVLEELILARALHAEEVGLWAAEAAQLADARLDLVEDATRRWSGPQRVARILEDHLVRGRAAQARWAAERMESRGASRATVAFRARIASLRSAPGPQALGVVHAEPLVDTAVCAVLRAAYPHCARVIGLLTLTFEPADRDSISRALRDGEGGAVDAGAELMAAAERQWNDAFFDEVLAPRLLAASRPSRARDVAMAPTGRSSRP